MLDVQTEAQPNAESTCSSAFDKIIRMHTLDLNQYSLKDDDVQTLKSSLCSNEEMIPLLNFPLYVIKEVYSFFNGVKGYGCFLVCLKTSYPLAMKYTNWENTKLIDTIWGKKSIQIESM